MAKVRTIPLLESILKAASVFLLYILVVCWSLISPVYALSELPSAWISYVPSRHGSNTDNWDLVRLQVSTGKIFQLMQRNSRVTNLVIPVFEDGQAFFTTEIEPFKGRNTKALSDEQILSEILQKSQKADVPVYLGVDVLSWQLKNLTPSGEKSGIFATHPAWREVTGGNALPQTPEAFFASPFNNDVRNTILSLVREIGHKFPLAAGIVLNVGLSDREIVGFSETARIASIMEIGIDPIDLNLQNRADEKNTKFVYKWMNWKREQMTLFVKNLNETYKKSNPKGRVVAMGSADYYQRQEFNDLRRTQDWRFWLQQGIIDGVLLEGHWQSRYIDSRSFSDFSEETAALAREKGKSLTFVPVSHGAHRNDSSYARDWANLKSRTSSLDEMVLVVESDEDLQQAVGLLSGKVTVSRFESPRLGEVLPEFTLPDTTGKMWEANEKRGQHSTLLLVAGEKAPVLHTLFKDWEQNGVLPVIVTDQIVDNGKVTTLKDMNHELSSWFTTGIGYVLVDRAGFVRRLFPIQNSAQWSVNLQKPVDPTPLLKEGQNAPEFTVRDMNSQVLRLSDYKGKKHLLLTFFPRCFTGGCKQHLASLQANENELEKSGIAVVAVSVDPPDTQQAFAESLGARFKFIPDVGRNVCILYGATSNITDLAKRMSILIDKEGIVRWIDTDVNVQTHGQDVLAEMRELGLIK